MTRANAIEILERWLEKGKGNGERIGYVEGWFHANDEEAFGMAIKALKRGTTDKAEREQRKLNEGIQWNDAIMERPKRYTECLYRLTCMARFDPTNGLFIPYGCSPQKIEWSALSTPPKGEEE